MRDRIIKSLFSLNGASLGVGVAGFLSALVTMFVNTSEQVSIKIVLLLLWLLLTVFIILLKLVFDLSSENKAPLPYEIPIRYLVDDLILLIRKNDNFSNQIVVGCYSNVDDIERLISLGAVHHVQDDYIQIKLYPTQLQAEYIISKQFDVKRVLVRPVVPFNAYMDYMNN